MRRIGNQVITDVHRNGKQMNNVGEEACWQRLGAPRVNGVLDVRHRNRAKLELTFGSVPGPEQCDKSLDFMFVIIESLRQNGTLKSL